MAFIGLDTNTTKEVFCTLESLADIPLTDEAAWRMYPKYSWVYSTSRLLDLQNIKWQPFYSSEYSSSLTEFNIGDDSTECSITGEGCVSSAGEIFVVPIQGRHLTTNVVLLKGEVKWLSHHTTGGDLQKHVLDDVDGGLELRISAVAKMALAKFTGVITVHSIGGVVVGIRLRMTSDVIDQYPKDWLKNVVKLYNRKQWPK